MLRFTYIFLIFYWVSITVFLLRGIFIAFGEGINTWDFIYILATLFHIVTSIYLTLYLSDNTYHDNAEKFWLTTFAFILGIFCIFKGIPALYATEEVPIVQKPCPVVEEIRKEESEEQILDIGRLEELFPKSIVKEIIGIQGKCNASNISTVGNNAFINCGNIDIVFKLFPAPPQTPVPLTSILSREYQWAYASDKKLTNVPSPNLTEFENSLKSLGMQDMLSKSNHLIAVGTASKEGELLSEIQRADQRSKIIMSKVKNNLPSPNSYPKFYYLNLGKYDEICNSLYTDTSGTGTVYQRPLIVVGTLGGKDAGIEIVESEVKKSLESLPEELNASCYSNFDFSS